MKVSGTHVQSVLKKTTGVNNLTFKNTFCCRQRCDADVDSRANTQTQGHARKQGYDGLSQINRPSQVKQQ